MGRLHLAAPATRRRSSSRAPVPRLDEMSLAPFSGSRSPVEPARLPVSSTPFTQPALAGPAPVRTSAVSDELASALAKLAVEYAPAPVSTAPFVSVKDREGVVRAQRRVWRVRLLKGAGMIFVAACALHLLATTLLFRLPPAEALESEVAQTAQALLLLHTSGDRPLEITRAIPVLREEGDGRHLRYQAEVTLRLRQPLYGPALTNGTVNYRMLQTSLELARKQELMFEFFPAGDGPRPPDLPRLIHLTHRAGEAMIVRVPFEAERIGWKWRVAPSQLAKRTVDRRFEGSTLDRFNDAPYLVFGVPETMPDIRARMKAARDYVTAISREIQRRADVEAVVEAPAETADPALADREAAPALDAALLFDPNRPAVELPRTPIQDQPARPR